MSRVPTPRRASGATRSLRSASLRLTFLIATLLGLATLAPAAQAVVPGNISRADLCQAWTASTHGEDISLQGGVTVQANTMGRVGSSCIAPNAELRLRGVNITQETTGPTGTAAASILAAVTRAAGASPDLKVGDELFYGAYIKTFNASLKLGYFDISGEVDVQWTGGNLSRFMFKGRLYGIDRFNVTVYSPIEGTFIPNIGGAKVNYSGILQLAGKKYNLALTGSAPSITVGTGDKQVSVSDATIALNLANAADGSQHLHADVTGQVGIGSGITANGTLSGDFDDAGLSKLSGTGGVNADFPASATIPAGNITGDATFSYTKDPAAYDVDFAGTVKVGDTIVTNATGKLDDQSLTFKGDATFANDQITAKGAVDGVYYYGDALDGRTITNKAGQQVQASKGDFFIKTLSGDVATKGISVGGAAQIGSVGSDRWIVGSGAVDLSFTPTGLPLTTIKGNATVDYRFGGAPSVTFSGQVASGDMIVANAKGAIDGQKIDFTGDVKYTGAQLGVTGAIDGTVYYGAGLSGLTIKNHAGTAVAATKGDFVVRTASGSVTAKGLTASGTASVTRVGAELSAKGSGKVDLTFNTTQLKGSADIDWVSGATPTVGFSGSVSSNGLEVASVSGTVDGAKLALKGNGTLNVSGYAVKAGFDGTLYYGADQTGQTIVNRAGATVQPTKGDLVVRSLSADVTAKNLAVSGNVRISKVGSDIWSVVTGKVDATFGTTNVKGSATVGWVVGQQPTVAFAGTLTQGTTTVANASGTLDGNKIALKGDITYKDASLSATGAVEGTVYYGPDLSGEKVTDKAGVQVTPSKGDWVLTKASGGVAIKDLDVTGGLTISSVGGQQWATASGSIDATYNGTRIKGTAIGTASSDGSASVAFDGTITNGDISVAGKGLIDGKKISLSGTASMVNSTMSVKGSIDGTVYYGADLTGEKITNRAGAQVQPAKGDFFIKSATADVAVRNLAVSGAATIGKVGSDIWVKGGGTVDATYSGLQLKGSADFDWLVGSPFAVNYSGSVATGGTTIASATGTIDGKKITLKGTAQLTYNGYTARGAADAVAYYGTDLAGETVTNKAGAKIPASQGDLVLSSASAQITAKGLTVTGSVEFHKLATDLWTIGKGTVDATFGATTIKGTADLTWNNTEQPSVLFAGTLTSGTTTVASAAGTLDGAKITLKGNATYTADGLVVNGAVDGIVYYGSDLSGLTVTNKAGAKVAATKGDYVLNSASVGVSIKGLDLTGGLTLSSVGGDMWGTANGTVDLTYNGTKVSGKGAATFSKGATPVVSFEGTVVAGALTITGKGTVDGKKITVSGTGGLTAGGITAGGSFDGVVYYGKDLSGETVVNKAGATVPALQGDVVVKSVTADVTAKGLAVKAGLSVSKVGTDLWAKGSGSVDATYGATNLKGSATIDWAMGGQPTVAFSGTVTSGQTIVANASGTLDGAKIVVKGDVTYATDALTVKGAAAGTVYYGSDLSAEKVTDRAGAQVTPAKGDWVLKTASGGVTIKGLDLTGGLTLSSVGGDLWGTANGTVDLTYNGTNIKGSASAEFAKTGTPTVAFTGTVTSGDVVVSGSGTIDGTKVTLKGTGKYTNSSVTVNGALDGVVYYGSDLSAEQVTNRAGAQVTPARGDFLVKSASADLTAKGIALTGGATIGKVGSELWVKGGGTLDATYNGVAVKGSADFDWLVGSPFAVNYTGSVAYNGTQVATATGTIDTKKITLKGTAQASYSGIDAKGTADVVVYYGSDLSGETVTNKAGAQVAATKGDVIVRSATATVTAKGLTVTGSVAISKVGSDLWLTGNGSVDLTLGTTSLKGSATFGWAQGGAASVAFTGSVNGGATVMANATGTLDGAKIAIKGDATYTDSNLTVKGAADGVLYYGSDLSAEQVTNKAGASVTPAKGDFVVKSASVGLTIKGLAITGGLTLSSVGGDQWGTANGTVDLTYNGTTLKGSATAAFSKGGTPSVSFDGVVTSGDVVVTGKGTLDGAKIALGGTATWSNALLSLKGSVDATVYYGSDLSAEKVTNRAGTQVTPARGDFVIKSASADLVAKGFAVSGAASGGSVAGQKWVKGGGSVDLTYNGTNLKGSADVDWLVGTTPTVSFSGSVSSGGTTIASASGTVDGQKVALRGNAQITYSGITAKGSVDAVYYYGSDLSGATVTNRAGAQVQATKGDLIVNSATADITAQNLAVTGKLALSKVGSDLWATGSGAVDLTWNGTNLKGSATINWALGQTPSVSFDGGVTSGTTVVASATGTLDGAKIALKGTATVQYNGSTITGSVDGVLFYGSNLSGQTIADRNGTLVEPLQGDWNIKSASGSLVAKGLTLSGGIAAGSVRGDKWVSGGGSIDLVFSQVGQPDTRVQGTATLAADGTVKFSGKVTYGDQVFASAEGTADGKKISFSAQVTSPTVSGKATGVVYYGDNLSGETMKNKAGTAVQATKGDFKVDVTDGTVVLKQLTASAGRVSLNRVGTAWWITAGANIKVGDTFLVFSGDIDSSGQMYLTASGKTNLGGYPIDFNGSASVKDNRLVITGNATVYTDLFTVVLAGTIEKPNMNVDQYTFLGKAAFKFGSFQIADATVRLTFGEGLTTTLGVKTCFLFICPNASYKLYFQGGKVARAEMNAPIAWVAQFLIIGQAAMPGVPISTTITGLF